MTKVGLLSDTHGYWDEKYLQYFEGCDEIWHAGDIGSLEVAQKLAAFRPFRAVYGNIDGQDLRHFQRTDVTCMPYFIARLEVLQILLIPIPVRIRQ